MKSFVAVLAFIAALTADCNAGSWGYGETLGGVYGPADWHHVAPHCAGQHQSPVNIDKVKMESGLVSKLSLDFGKLNGRVIGSFTNNGHSPTFAIDKTYGTVVLKGGPLDGNYELQQFHFHFGCTSAEGSEHTQKGKAFPAELHLVFYNKKYGNFSNAVDKSDGLSVIGIFLKEYKKHANKVLRKITTTLPEITEEGETVNFDEDDAIDLAMLVPEVDKYFTYNGSLTTPPCYESVKWIILEKHIRVTEKQLKQFRMLKSKHGYKTGLLCNNFRPVQSINGRFIYKIK